MNQVIENFEFIRPAYLIALVPLFIGYALLLIYAKNQNLWQQIIPQHLYQKMVISKGIQQSSHFVHIALLGFILSIIAIAGPSWEKLPQAVYQSQAGKVILMDMSLSMRATDLQPDRLTRARFKAIDLLNEVQEGETGIVAYAGDAFVVSPLTDDANNLKTLIPVLSPEIMPTQGSSAYLGLIQASELLVNAGYQTGQIYWISDGIRYNEVREIREFIQQSPYDISALLIGTEQGAPVTLEDGQLLKESSGKIVIPSINSRFMQQAMQGTNATYELFASDNSDILAIKRKLSFSQQEDAQAVENISGDTLRDTGPYLVLLLLPLAAYAFRKGVLTVLLVSTLSGACLVTSNGAIAQQANSAIDSAATPSKTVNTSSSATAEIFNQVFKNADQRAKEAFDKQEYAKASELFESKAWQAASAYKLGDYASAADLYGELDGMQNLYNKGNALAKSGNLQDALEAYNQVLQENGEHEQAAINKQIVEQMLEQQSQQQEQQGDNEQSDDAQSPEQDSQKEQQQNKDQQGDQQQDDQQKDGQQQDNSDDQNQEQQSQAQNNDAENENSDKSEQSQSQQQNSDNSEDNEQSQDNPESSESDKALKDAAKQQSEQNNAEPQMPEESTSEGTGETLQSDGIPSPEEQAPQQPAISNQLDMSELTPEEQEELQRMQMILNKVPDNPAYLLKRKMLLEAYKRKGTAPPPTTENW